MIKRENAFSLVYLLVLQIARAGLQVFLFRQGFVSVSADEFTRAIRALKWSNQFVIDFGKDFNDVWLPFEKYLNGFALKIYPEAIITPRITVFIFSCLAVVGLFVLLKVSFDSYIVAMFGAFVASFQPWFVWLSGTPMLEMYYFPFLFFGIAFIVYWLKNDRSKYAYFAGICFLFGSGFHIQSWVFINTVNLLVFGLLIKKSRLISKNQLLPYFGLFFISNLLIGLIWLYGITQTGDLLAPFQGHVNYSRWYYSYDHVDWLDRFFYYPKLVWNALPTTLWFLIFIGIVTLAAIAEERKLRNFVPLVVGSVALLINSVINISSAPATAAPERFSLFYTTLFSPYCIIGIIKSPKFMKKIAKGKYLQTFIVYLFILFLFIGYWQNATKILNFPIGMAEDTIRTGYFLQRMVKTESLTGKILIELKFWDFQAIRALVDRDVLIVYDRELDIYNRNLPSILTQSSILICDYIIDQNINWIVLQDETLKTIVGQQSCLNLRKDIGRWKVFEVK